MEVVVAKTAGFCFGVDKAVKLVYDLLGTTKGSIYTFGPIIHNEQVVENLKSKGVDSIDDLDGIEPGSDVIIRAHGVGPATYEKAREKNIKIHDATCPYVKKIHDLVREKHAKGYGVIIIGDKNHPEVIGVNGWCGNTALIVNNREDLNGLSKDSRKMCVFAQTTITSDKWEELNKELNNIFENLERFDTICNATSTRQSEAAELAKKMDMMFVVGGKNSSNTQKLFDICKKFCKDTFKIETSGDIPPMDIKHHKKIGITAGASTPEWVIKEVIERMDELNKMENELSFKEAFESSLVTLTTGEIVKGKIIGFNNAEVFIDMGYKSDGIIPISEFSDDPDFDPEKSLKAGDEVEVFIIRVNDGEGNVLLSKKKVDSIKNIEKIEEAYEKKLPVKVKVTDVTNGGVIANAGGVRVFIPASQISDRYVKELNEFLKKTLDVRIVEYNKQKRKIVGSHRIILEEEKGKKEGAVWETIEVGKIYTGTVKSLTDFGAFVDIGGVDGLIHISEMSWSKIKHPSEVMKVGDTVEVKVLEFEKEKRRISLGYRKVENNPWYNIAEKFKAGDIVKGKVVRLVPFGAFIEMEQGVDGLVHISQISSVRIAKPGDVLQVGMEVEAKVTEINAEAKKISLSIKEVNPIDPEKKKDDQKEEAAAAEKKEEVPSEHKEELSNTIGDILNSPKDEEKE